MPLGVPKLNSPQATRYLVTVQYDGQPLRQGAFFHEDSMVIHRQICLMTNISSQTIRGLRPALTHDIAISQDVLQNGPRALLSSLADTTQYKYVSEVVEVIAVTTNSALRMNTHTFFCCAGESNSDIDERINRILSDLSVCQECILDGMSSIRTCKRVSPNAPCSNCENHRRHCHSLLVIHVFADMASTQAKAHRLRSPTWHSSINGSFQPSFGHGFLHIAKSLVGACRNYHLTNGDGEFSIVDLSALYLCQHSPLMSAFLGVSALIHSYKDRHSDDLAFQTVSRECEEVLRLADYTKVTLVPEQYHAYRSKNHEWIQRPLCVACTNSGRFFWSDFDSQRIFVGDRHNPGNLYHVCALNVNGGAQVATGSMRSAKLKAPTGLAVIRHSHTDVSESLVVCTGGVPGLVVLCNVHDVSNKSSTWITPTWSKEGMPQNFKPFGVSAIGVNQCCVVDKWGGGVHIIDYVGNGLEFRLSRTMQGFLRPTSAAALKVSGEVWILVATASGLKCFNLEHCNEIMDVLNGGTSNGLFGVAVSSDRYVCVSIPSKNQCHIFSVVQGHRPPKLELLVTVGDGYPGFRDGSPGDCQLNEPCGIAVRNGVFLVCCVAGEHQGSICRISCTKFAQEYIACIRAIYDGGDFVPLKLKGKGTRPNLCLTQGIGKLSEAITFLDAMEQNRREVVGFTPSGLHGCFPVQTLRCLKLTRNALQQCSTIGGTLSSLVLSGSLNTKAFLDESVVEFSFGHHSLHGVNRSRSLEEYSQGKQYEVRALIRRICRTNFSYFVKESRYYTPGDVCPLDAEDILGIEDNIHAKIRQSITSTEDIAATTSERGRDATIVGHMRRISGYLRAQPTQTVRDKYRKACGYAPTIIMQPANTGSGERQLDRISEEVRVALNRANSKARSQNSVVSNQFIAYEGDFVAVEADIEWIEEESERRGGVDPSPYWLMQLLEPIRVGQNRPNCMMNGVWLEFVDVDVDACRRYRLGESQAIRYMKLLVDESGDLFVVAWDHTRNAQLISEYDSVLYRFSADVDDVIAEILSKYSDQDQSTESIEVTAPDDVSDHAQMNSTGLATRTEPEQFQEIVRTQTRERRISTRFRGRVNGYAELAKA